jgi:hypothetical protein
MDRFVCTVTFFVRRFYRTRYAVSPMSFPANLGSRDSALAAFAPSERSERATTAN